MSRLTYLTAWLLLGAASFAQNVAPVPAPLPTRMPAARAPGGDASAATVRNLEFPNADVKEVLAFYEQITGKRLIYDSTVQGPVNIVVKREIPREEAIRLIEMNLLMNNWVLVPAGKDIIKVIGGGKNARGYGIPIFSDESQLPDNEQVVSFLMKLQYADPTEVAQTLGQYVVASQGQFNQLLPLPKSQAILVTENTVMIRGLIEIVRQIDVPPAEVVSEFIPLERADAKDILEKLQQIFEKNQPNQTGAPVVAGVARAIAQRPVTTPEGTVIPPDAVVTSSGPNTVEISAGTLSEESIIIGKIKLTADIRTNRIHVITRPDNLPFIRKLVREFDQDVKFGEPSLRPLQFVSAGDIIQTVVRAIADPGAKDDVAGVGGATRQQGNRGTGGAAGGDLFSNGSSGSGTLGGGSGGRSGGGLSLSESLNTEERDVIPEAFVVGNARIIADKRANTIIVLGNEEVKNKVFALLEQLDVRAPQVMLHTVIGELNLTNTERFGVNYILRNGNARGLLTVTPGTGNGGTGGGTGGGTDGNGDGTGTGASAPSGSPITFNNGTPNLNLTALLGNQNITQLVTAGAGGLSGFVTAGNAFNAIVDLLESTNRFRVVSRPSIFTSNNKKAVIASGEEIAVPTSIQSGFGGGSVNNGSNLVTQSSIQFKTVALQLEVLPLINSKKEVTLDIVQKVDERAGTTRIDNNDIPNIATRVIKTNVSVPNEGTLVLGGLIKQTQNRTTSGIPLLSKLPLLGPLFRTTSKDKSRTELVILIRPVVTMDPCEATDLREKEMEYLNIEPDLESTVYPTNLRKKAGSEPALRRSPLILRQPSECVDDQILGFKK